MVWEAWEHGEAAKKGSLAAQCLDESCNKIHRMKIYLQNCQPGSRSHETCKCAEAAVNPTSIKEDDIQQ